MHRDGRLPFEAANQRCRRNAGRRLDRDQCWYRLSGGGGAALRRLARQHAFTLRIIATDSAPLATLDLVGVRVEFVPWQGPQAVQELLQFDVGIMPLPADQEWTRYKCGLKLLQYMAVGIPAVASPVGVNADIVQHGCNGFLAAADQEWSQALEQLLVDPNLRRRIGAEGRRTVQESYSVEAYVPRYLEAFAAARRFREAAERR